MLLEISTFEASDLLQSNGVIWVEGPSDRVYVNHLLSLRFEGRLREGAHYQCVHYGGSVLARLSAEPNETTLMSILSVNRNAALVMDQDTDPLSDTKRRMISEMRSVGGHIWTTSGKEIECLIPREALVAYFGEPELPPFEGLEAFDVFLSRTVGETEARRYLRDKTLFAERMAPMITFEMIEENAVLLSEVDALGAAIQEWNPGI